MGLHHYVQPKLITEKKIFKEIKMLVWNIRELINVRPHLRKNVLNLSCWCEISEDSTVSKPHFQVLISHTHTHSRKKHNNQQDLAPHAQTHLTDTWHYTLPENNSQNLQKILNEMLYIFYVHSWLDELSSYSKLIMFTLPLCRHESQCIRKIPQSWSCLVYLCTI